MHPLNMKTLALFPRILATAVLCLAAGGLSSCIVSTGKHFKNMGQEGQCILTHQRKDKTLELYRAGDKVYVKGTLASFREYDPDIVTSIDLWDRTHKLTTQRTPRKTVYKELQLRRYTTHDVKNTGKERFVYQWHSADSHVLTELPEGARPFFSRAELSAHSYPEVKDADQWHTAIVTEELGADWHAIYAYPLAAVCYVGIDTPVIMAQVVALPFIMCYASIADLFRQENVQPPHKE